MPAPDSTAGEADRATALWPGYYQATLGRPPGRLLLDALSRLEPDMPSRCRRRAVDLGYGAGNDTVELLKRGWSVVAIDQTPEASTCLLQRPDLPERDRLEIVTADLAAATWPSADLVYARACLPFVSPSAFAAVWQKVVSALAPGGRFAGDFFGDRDDWASLPTRTHHTREQVVALLEPFEIELLDEVERDGAAFPGVPKHWHRFEVVGRKR